MKRKLNTVFFGVSFLAAILLESYCIQRINEDMISVGGMGIVVLITGYLLLGSIKEDLLHTRDRIKNYVEEFYRVEMLRQKDKDEETNKVMKATYMTLKKNTALIQKSMEELQNRMDSLEKERDKDVLMLIELQKKSLSGQKNALHMQLNYDNQNTKKIVKAILDPSNQEEQNKLIRQAIDLSEYNNKILQETMIHLNAILRKNDTIHFDMEEIDGSDQIGNDISYDIGDDTEYKIGYDIGQDTSYEIGNDIENENGRDFDYEVGNDAWNQIGADTGDNIKYDHNDIGNDTRNEEYVETDPIYSELGTLNYMYDSEKMENPDEEEDISYESESGSKDQTEASSVVPLYEDPNKSLTADEIASLFASFGS